MNAPVVTAPAHTPGPWWASRRSILRRHPETGITCLAEVFSGPADTLAEADANEKLIAAAPDLYEALDDLLDQVLHAPGGHLLLTGLARKALQVAREGRR